VFYFVSGVRALALPFTEKSFFAVLTDNSKAGLLVFFQTPAFCLQKQSYSFSDLACLPGGQRLRLNGKSGSFTGLINRWGKGAFAAVKHDPPKG
jgi:hypothetical protein